ncbi:hypothetical protein [Corallococcus sp. AS-1-6]|uniref:hypothetical protein n=1 Tax=Corallococcus sp. AS-1-6 TaxID=2874599 RepID=UPI001CC1BB08|nr:hypothetical protein [Corallococcus sp. AS-1-6]MBZ4371472.1 hypothetical protein [Corallococcus sp. AS-1-6]
MTTLDQQRRLQQLADDLRGCDLVVYPVTGPGFAGLALAARDGSGRTATLSFDDALRARLGPSPRGLVMAARAALGLPASADQAEPSDVDRKVGGFHIEVSADISNAAAEIKALDAQIQETADAMAKVSSGPVAPSDLTGLINASAAAFRALLVRDNSGRYVDENVMNQVADDVAAMVAYARAIACRE